MRRDFEKYFTKLQLDYNSILKQKTKIDEEYKKGLVDETQYNNFLNYFYLIKVNYDRMHYARYLIHKPPKFIENILNKLNERDAKKLLNEYKENKADDESVLAENKDAIEKAELITEDK